MDFFDAEVLFEKVDVAVAGGELEAGGVPRQAGVDVVQMPTLGHDEGAIVGFEGAGGAGLGFELDVQGRDLKERAFGFVAGGEALELAVGQADRDLA